MTTEGKWVRFDLAEKQNPKTSIWNVVAKEGGYSLGQIKWFGQWRKYSFYPTQFTVYESDCLHDIANFLLEQTKRWKHRNSPRHLCGLQGYNPMLGDKCEACDLDHERRERQRKK